MDVGARGVVSGGVDVMPRGEVLTADEGGRERLELEVAVEDDPIGDGELEVMPVGDALPTELVDPTPDAAVPDNVDPDRLDPDRVDPDRLDPDGFDPDGFDPDSVDPGDSEDPVVVELRLDVAGEVDERDVPLVPTGEGMLVDNGAPLALLIADDSGLVELRLLPIGCVTALELGAGLHGCGSVSGS